MIRQSRRRRQSWDTCTSIRFGKANGGAAVLSPTITITITKQNHEIKRKKEGEGKQLGDLYID